VNLVEIDGSGFRVLLLLEKQAKQTAEQNTKDNGNAQPALTFTPGKCEIRFTHERQPFAIHHSRFPYCRRLLAAAFLI